MKFQRQHRADRNPVGRHAAATGVLHRQRPACRRIVVRRPMHRFVARRAGCMRAASAGAGVSPLLRRLPRSAASAPRRRRSFLFSGRNDRRRRCDAMLLRPGDFFRRAEAAARFPAALGRLTAATVPLAGERTACARNARGERHAPRHGNKANQRQPYHRAICHRTGAQTANQTQARRQSGFRQSKRGEQLRRGTHGRGGKFMRPYYCN